MKDVLIALLRNQIGDYDGSPMSTDYLCRFLHTKNLDFDIVCPKTNADREYNILSYLNSKWKDRYLISNVFKYINFVKKHAKKYKLLLLILPNPSFAYIADLINHKNIIVRFESSLHDLKIENRGFNLSTLYFILSNTVNGRYIANLSNFSADYYSVSSEFQKKELIGLSCPEKKIVLLPNVSQPMTNQPQKKKENVISYIGHFNYVKGTHVLIKSINYIVKKHKKENIKFQFASVKNFYQKRELLKQIQKYKLSDYIIFNDIVDIPKFLSNSKAIVLPYLHPFGTQIFPNILIESIHLKIPIITTKLPHLKELLTDNVDSLMVQPNDYKALGDKIIEVNKNKKLRRQLSINLNKLSNRISSKKILNSHYKFLKKCLKNH